MIYVTFEYGQENRFSERFGPFLFVQITYSSLRVGEEGEEFLGQFSDGLWHCSRDGQAYSDVVIN
jgi:hypothetical protein